MIRVLIAEDSPTSLELLMQVIASDRELTVEGTAHDGATAVAMTRWLRPDVVVMDIHMDGFEATRQIMGRTPTPIVIVSGIDAGEVAVSMRALRAGALSLLPKPPGPLAPDFEETCVRFTSTVRAMAQVKVFRRLAAPTMAPPPPLPEQAGARPIRVVAIAAATGGPAALYRILSELPRDLPVPILIAQHIAPGFVTGLATWLGSASLLTVKVAEDGESLRPGRVYLAPDGCHLGVSERETVSLVIDAATGGFRRSATFLFESVASSCGASALAVILTGTGEDGLVGLRAVRAAGGTILAQDEESAVVFGMPGIAIAEGLADMIVSLDALPARVKQLVFRNGRERTKS